MQDTTSAGLETTSHSRFGGHGTAIVSAMDINVLSL
jgi:hypothetical protein